jgi:hypothetical protein
MADSSTTQQKTAHTPIPGADEKNASLKLFLSADSGYHAETEYRVSANQWAAILQIGEETAALGAAAWVADPKVKESLRSFHETTRVLKAAALAAAPDTAAERDRLREINAELVTALRNLVEEFGGTIAQYYKFGPNWTHKDGTEVFDASTVLDREPLIEAARALITKAEA